MPKYNKKLTELQIKSAKPKDKAYKIYDDGGLRLLVRPSGTKVWQYPYKFNGKSNIYTIGKVGEISTADARQKRDEIKALLRQHIDPNQQKKAEEVKRWYENRNSFEALAREWHAKQLWEEKHAKNILSRLEKDVFPYVGRKAITKVTRQDVLYLLHKIEKRGSLDVAQRIMRA